MAGYEIRRLKSWIAPGSRSCEKRSRSTTSDFSPQTSVLSRPSLHAPAQRQAQFQGLPVHLDKP
ncbi:MAG: hypothetical protein KQI81_24565, partial [Deltaproteobacteria bacterium]|nr:hypothetical protein [Deltaproteobacteria bacterium]